MTPIQTRWLQHLAATSGLPPHELARRLRQPLDDLAEVWGVTVGDLQPPKPAEPAQPVPIARQLPAPDLGEHVHHAPELSHLSHAGIPVPESSGPVIPATPKPGARLRIRSDVIEDEPPKPPRHESIEGRYEHLRAIQEENPLPPPTGPVRIK